VGEHFQVAAGPVPASISPMVSVASLNALRSRCAYFAVVAALECPSNFPTLYSGNPRATRRVSCGQPSGGKN
jgi:hypothetical protein